MSLTDTQPRSGLQQTNSVGVDPDTVVANNTVGIYRIPGFLTCRLQCRPPAHSPRRLDRGVEQHFEGAVERGQFRVAKSRVAFCTKAHTLGLVDQGTQRVPFTGEAA